MKWGQVLKLPDPVGYPGKMKSRFQIATGVANLIRCLAEALRAVLSPKLGKKWLMALMGTGWNGWVWDSIWVCNVGNPIIYLSFRNGLYNPFMEIWGYGLGFTINDSPCFWVMFGAMWRLSKKNIARRGVSAHELLLTWELRSPISICATGATIVVTWLVGKLQCWKF